MNAISFSAVIRLHNINPYVHVSAARAATLKSGWRKPLPVCLRINDKPDIHWRINMMPMGGGDYYLYLHGLVRQAAGVQVGDRVRVELSFDTEYRGGPAVMPACLRIALSKNARAKQGWKALSPSRKKEVIRYIARLKSAEARDRNVAKALQVLSGQPGRFMARSWVDGA